MGDCGLRVEEMLYVTPGDISRKMDGRSYELEVVKGKDTTGKYNGGKQRETWMPVDLERRIHQHTRRESIEDDEPLIPRSKKTVQNWVTNAADRAAEKTGDSDYERVSSHDLRRCWAQLPFDRRRRLTPYCNGSQRGKFLRCDRTLLDGSD